MSTNPAKNPTTIIRAPRDKDNPYFALRRKTAQDSRLSFEARGALAYLLSRPGNWNINLADLQREGNIGRDQGQRILKELERYGYLVKEAQTRDEKSRFNPVVLVVQEIPHTENPLTVSPAPPTGNPSTGEPEAGEPSPENPPHTEYKESQRDGVAESGLEVDQKTEDSKTEKSTATLESVDSSAQNAAAAALDDEWGLIEKDIRGLGLPGAIEAQLRALGAVTALAIWLQTQQAHIQNPAGLAITLINDPAQIPLKAFEDAQRSLMYRGAVLTSAPQDEIEIAAHDALVLAGDPAQRDLPALVDIPPVTVADEPQIDTVSILPDPPALAEAAAPVVMPEPSVDPLDIPIFKDRPRTSPRIAFITAKGKCGLLSPEMDIGWLFAAQPLRIDGSVLVVAAPPGGDKTRLALQKSLINVTQGRINEIKWVEAVAV